MVLPVDVPNSGVQDFAREWGDGYIPLAKERIQALNAVLESQRLTQTVGLLKYALKWYCFTVDHLENFERYPVVYGDFTFAWTTFFQSDVRNGSQHTIRSKNTQLESLMLYARTAAQCLVCADDEQNTQRSKKIHLYVMVGACADTCMEILDPRVWSSLPTCYEDNAVIDVPELMPVCWRAVSMFAKASAFLLMAQTSLSTNNLVAAAVQFAMVKQHIVAAHVSSIRSHIGMLLADRMETLHECANVGLWHLGIVPELDAVDSNGVDLELPPSDTGRVQDPFFVALLDPERRQKLPRAIVEEDKARHANSRHTFEEYIDRTIAAIDVNYTPNPELPKFDFPPLPTPMPADGRPEESPVVAQPAAAAAAAAAAPPVIYNFTFTSGGQPLTYPPPPLVVGGGGGGGGGAYPVAAGRPYWGPGHHTGAAARGPSGSGYYPLPVQPAVAPAAPAYRHGVGGARHATAARVVATNPSAARARLYANIPPSL